MNVEFLEGSEALVECWVRGLTVDSKDIAKTLPRLKSAITNELYGSAISPNKPHISALKNPSRELTLCFDKLSEIKEKALAYLKENKDDDNTFDICRSRLYHILGRIKRISNISIVKFNALTCSTRIETLIEIIENYLCNMVGVEETLAGIETIITEPEENNITDDKETESNPDDALDIPGTSTGQLMKNNTFLLPVQLNTSRPTHLQNDPLVNLSNEPEPPANNTNLPVNNALNFSLSQFNSETEAGISRNLNVQPPTLSETFQVPSSSHFNPNIQRRLHDNIRFSEENNNQSYVIPQSTPFTNINWHGPRSPASCMQSWNLNFDGSCKEFTVEEFIFRTEHLAKTSNIPLVVVADNLYILLRGIALQFYWECIKKLNVNTWPALKSEMISRFKNRHIVSQIRSALDIRKQKYNESFYSFYNSIMTISAPMQDLLSQDDLLNILRKNMRPGLRAFLAIRRYESVNELVNDCIEFEQTWSEIDYNPEFACLSRKRVSEISNVDISSPLENLTLNPEFEQPPELCAMSSETIKYGYRDQKSISRKFHTNKEIICWNCHIVGHTFKNCELPLQHERFCYGCGTANVLKPHCKKCNSQISGNAQKSVLTTGGQHTQNPTPNIEKVEAATNVDPEFYRILHRK